MYVHTLLFCLLFYDVDLKTTFICRLCAFSPPCIGMSPTFFFVCIYFYQYQIFYDSISLVPNLEGKMAKIRVKLLCQRFIACFDSGYKLFVILQLMCNLATSIFFNMFFLYHEKRKFYDSRVLAWCSYISIGLYCMSASYRGFTTTATNGFSGLSPVSYN